MSERAGRASLLTRGKIWDLFGFALAAQLSQRRRRQHNEDESRRSRLSGILFLAAAEKSHCAQHRKERAFKGKSQIRIQARGLCCTDGVLAHCLFYNPVKGSFLPLFATCLLKRASTGSGIANVGMQTAGSFFYLLNYNMCHQNFCPVARLNSRAGLTFFIVKNELSEIFCI